MVATQVQLPPSERDFQVYQRVVLEGVSTRQAAGELKLSQTRVRQLVKRVSLWLAEALPPRSETTDESHLNLARHVAAERLQYLFGEAMRGWRLLNEMKYANLALRVLDAQAKLPVMPGTLEALAADAIEGPLEDEVESQLCERTSNPPARDCSPCSPTAAPAAATATEPPVANPIPPTTSTELPHKASAARQAFLAPAQPPKPSGDFPVTELKITPEQLGFSSRSVLSRRERRKLRRSKA